MAASRSEAVCQVGSTRIVASGLQGFGYRVCHAQRLHHQGHQQRSWITLAAPCLLRHPDFLQEVKQHWHAADRQCQHQADLARIHA
jgi:hypothetical protein